MAFTWRKKVNNGVFVAKSFAAQNWWLLGQSMCHFLDNHRFWQLSAFHFFAFAGSAKVLCIRNTPRSDPCSSAPNRTVFLVSLHRTISRVQEAFQEGALPQSQSHHQAKEPTGLLRNSPVTSSKDQAMTSSEDESNRPHLSAQNTAHMSWEVQ